MQGSCGVWGDQSITHRADQHLWGNIIMRHLSRLSEATSQWAPLFFYFFFFFFCRYRQAKKKFLPHQQDSVWDFFFSIPPLHLAWVALLSLVCLTSVYDPELPLTDRFLNNAVKGDTHTHLFKKKKKIAGPLAMIWIPHTRTTTNMLCFFFSQICVSFEETGGAKIHKTDRHTHTQRLAERGNWFLPPPLPFKQTGKQIQKIATLQFIAGL